VTRSRDLGLVVPGALPLEPLPDETSPYALAIAAARRGVPDEEVRTLMEAGVADDDPRAHYSVATMYLHGAWGLSVDHRRAVRHLRYAASHGVREAMFDIAVSLELGKGVRKNRRDAFLWYLRAALRGDGSSMRRIANCYAAGVGVAADDSSALAWYEWAELLGADGGDAAEFRTWLVGTGERRG
jgi:TPR repeat protein